MEDKVQYEVKISNRLPALEILDDNADISRAWDCTRENIKTSVTVVGSCERGNGSMGSIKG